MGKIKHSNSNFYKQVSVTCRNIINILFEPRNYRYSTLYEPTHQIRMRNTNTRIFNTYQEYFYFLYHQHNGRLKIFQNLSFILLGLSQKWLNLKIWNFPKVYYLKIVFEEKFLRLTVKVSFQKNEYFKKVDFVIFFFSQ